MFHVEHYIMLFCKLNRGLPLATLDKDLMRAGKKAGVEPAEN